MADAKFLGVHQADDVEPPDGTLCVACSAPVSRAAGAGLFALVGARAFWTCKDCQPFTLRILRAASEAGWLHRVLGQPESA